MRYFVQIGREFPTAGHLLFWIAYPWVTILKNMLNASSENLSTKLINNTKPLFRIAGHFWTNTKYSGEVSLIISVDIHRELTQCVRTWIFSKCRKLWELFRENWSKFLTAWYLVFWKQSPATGYLDELFETNIFAFLSNLSNPLFDKFWSKTILCSHCDYKISQFDYRKCRLNIGG